MSRAEVSRRARVCVLSAVAIGCATVNSWYHGPRSDHFDGERFFNLEPFDEQPSADVIRWAGTRHRGVWNDTVVTQTVSVPRVSGELRVTMVNHATVLLQLDSLNILTDPVWSDRVGVESHVGPRRHAPPGVAFDSLPTIDVVLVSHDHYDHMDLPTLRRLQNKFHPRIITGLGNATYLASQGVKGVETIDWWQSLTVRSVRVTAVPAQHWSGRAIDDRRRTLWAGFVIDGATDTVYFAGDTGWGKFLDLIHRRWPSFSLALLPIAPFRPRWYMARKHLAPDDAVRAAQDLDAGVSVPIHWGTFELGDDGRNEAVDTLRAVVDSIPPDCRPPFVVLENGQSLSIAHPDTVGIQRRCGVTTQH